MSRGFIAALAGIAMTLLAWFGPWEWPAWPAFTMLRLAFGKGSDWVDLPFGSRAAVLTGLIAINVAFWATFAYAILRGIKWGFAVGSATER